MPRKVNHVFYEKLSFLKMYAAYERASKGKQKRRDVIAYSIDLETNLMNLVNNIKKKRYQIGNYHVFTIYEPKERIIQSLPFKDRIVHQWYVEEFIIPYVVPKFIKDTYACIKNRGTHKAALTCQHYMRLMKRKKKEYYILKCDIKKYFYSIDKNILYQIMCKYFKDKAFLEFTHQLIFDAGNSLGIPIGNYTSQYFANIYLNELDHFIKETLRVKYYIRYMDDFVLLLESKEKAKDYFVQISFFLNRNLHLELNQKSKYFSRNLGVDFCGYKIYETHLLLRKRSKKNIYQKIKKWNKLEKPNKNVLLCWNSWLAHAKHADTYKLCKKYRELIKFDIENL